MRLTRRALISGRAVPGHAPPAQCGVEIVSLLVSAWPECLATVAGAILGLGNTEIYARDPKGKLVVVLEEDSTAAIGAKINAISGLPHVLSAVMVFQASDATAS
jgi:periplasmic nitrate reductase NapD